MSYDVFNLLKEILCNIWTSREYRKIITACLCRHVHSVRKNELRITVATLKFLEMDRSIDVLLVFSMRNSIDNIRSHNAKTSEATQQTGYWVKQNSREVATEFSL